MAQGDKDTTDIPVPILPKSQSDRAVVKVFAQEVINTGFYRTKEEFRKAIRNFFDNIGKFKK